MDSDPPQNIGAKYSKIAEVRDAGHKGRGLYALRAIKTGEVIDKASGLFFSPQESRILLETPVFDHLLANPADFKVDGTNNTYALTMGDMTFCNHANPNNSVIEWTFDDVGLWLELRALRDIEAGEEVTIRYTNFAEYDADIFSTTNPKEG